MPPYRKAASTAQRRAAGIALHHPEHLRAKNRGLASMSLEDLMHLAATNERGLPRRASTPKGRHR